MSLRNTDPLLAITRTVIIALQALTVIGAAALLIGLPIIAFASDAIEADLRLELGKPDLVFPLMYTLCALAIMLLVVVLAFFFLRYLRLIVDTVGKGDPFVSANATRLTTMAWLMLAMQLAAAPLIALIYHLERTFEDTPSDLSANFDLSGVVLVLLLFILARVFRKGTEMRTDLEGTV